jgi:hypothetical protein
MATPDKDALAVIIGKMNKGAPGAGSMSPDDDLTAIAEELIAAIKGGDTSGVVSSLRAAFTAMEAQPHEEGTPPGMMEESNG